MKYLKAGAFFLAAFLIQPSLLNLLSIKGYTPNLMLGLVIVFSFLYENEMYGIVFGAVFGCLYDLCYNAVVGPMPIALVFTAIFIILIREFANIENLINMWVVALLSILLYYGINWGLYRLAGNPAGFMYILKMLPWEALYTMVVITAVYLVLIRKVIRYRKDRYFR